MTVGELLSRTSSAELMEWRVLLKIEASEQQQRAQAGSRVSTLGGSQQI